MAVEWQDDAIVLSARAYGDSAAVVQLLTRTHGRHAGLVRGGQSRKSKPLLQPGNRVLAIWKARLAEQLGTLQIELVQDIAGLVFDERLKLSGLLSACAMLEVCLPERAPHPELYTDFGRLIGAMLADASDTTWPADYVRFEIALLRDLGFALDLSACAVTGHRDGLVYVSPTSGRAVTAEGAGAYAPRLLPLPSFLVGGNDTSPPAIASGLRLSGAFLDKHVLAPLDRPMPAARERLADQFSKQVSEDDIGHPSGE
ncbi:MAG: DNA repair protein RecO [Geminicoccaceae bacterium]